MKWLIWFIKTHNNLAPSSLYGMSRTADLTHRHRNRITSDEHNRHPSSLYIKLLYREQMQEISMMVLWMKGMCHTDNFLFLFYGDFLQNFLSFNGLLQCIIYKLYLQYCQKNQLSFQKKKMKWTWNIFLERFCHCVYTVSTHFSFYHSCGILHVTELPCLRHE